MATGPDPDLDALVCRLADGDRAVFGAVFQRLWQPVFRLCRSMLTNDADAADAAQEAMEKILTRAQTYEPSRAALPWALAIAAYECRTTRRKRGRRREVPEETEPVSAAADAEDQFAHRELVQHVLAAIGELSESDRETLISTLLEEQASVGGSTLRKRRERALTRLRTTLKRLYGFD